MLKLRSGLALVLSLLVLLRPVSPLQAQNALPIPQVKSQWFDANGHPLAGGYIYFCVAGSSCTISSPGAAPSNPQATFTDSTGGVQNANPVVLDSGGFANIWLSSSIYKVIVTTAVGVVISTTDNVQVGGSNSNYLAPFTNAVLRTVNSKFADQVNGKDFSVKADGVTDDTPYINNALAAAPGKRIVLNPGSYKIAGNVSIPANTTLELGQGTYTLGNAGQFTLAGTASKLVCPGGPDATILAIPSTYTVTNGVIALTSGEPAGTVDGCQLKFSQPNDVTTRTGQIQYTAAGIYAVNQPRFRLRHLKIIGGWSGINATGNVYGSSIDDLQISSFNAAVLIDGPGFSNAGAGPVTITNVHWAPLGLTSNQGTAFLDPNNFGLWIGGAQGLMIKDFVSYGGQAFRFFAGVSTPTVTITNATIMAGNGIIMSSGVVTCASCTFLLAPSSAGGTFVAQTGGYLSITGSSFELALALPLAAGALTAITAAANGNTSLSVTGSVFTSGANDAAWIYGGSANAGETANVNISNNFFQTTINTAFSNAKIKLDTGSRGTVGGNIITDKGTGAGVFLNVIQDTYHKILGNTCVGFGISLPGGYTVIQYANNI